MELEFVGGLEEDRGVVVSRTKIICLAQEFQCVSGEMRQYFLGSAVGCVVWSSSLPRIHAEVIRQP